MSKRTIVSDYVENKLNSIKKDSFLEELSMMNISYKRQQELISEEIENIYNYIRLIKENKKCYTVANGRKTLSKPVKIYISNLRKIINKYFEYSRCLKLLERYQTRKDLIEKMIEFEGEEIILTSDQIKIMKTITKNNIRDISYSDLGDIAKYLLNNYESYDAKLEMIIKELGSRYKCDEYEDEEYIILSSVKNFITNKTNKLDKDDYRRGKLREYKKYLKSVIDLINEKENIKYDYRFDIVIYLTKDEYCFNRLLEEMPDIVNLCDRDGYSLAYNILEKYLDAYLLELQGKQGKINKESILQTYHKIISHPHYFNSSINKENIEELLSNFKEIIKNGRFKRDKYLEVVNNLENINTVCETELECQKISIEDIQDEKNYILNSGINTCRIDLCGEDTVVICTKNEKYHNYAYSVTKNSEGHHILKVHLTDMREFIKHDSMLDLFLKQNISKGDNNWLDDDLLNKFSLNKNEINPVFTFELEFLPNGKVNNFKCYKSNIIVNDIYTFEDVNSEINNHNLRFLPYLQVNYFMDKNCDRNNYGLTMTNTFNKTILNQIGSFFEKNKLPYIYKTQIKQNDARYMKYMTELNNLFSKISKDNFKTIHKIICEDINYSKYNDYPETHASMEQKYYSDLFIPLYSYVGLFIQEMLNQFYLNHYTGEAFNINKTIWNNEKKYIIKHANELKISKRNDIHKAKIKKLNGR